MDYLMGPKCHHKCPPYKKETGDFPRGPVARTRVSTAGGHRRTLVWEDPTNRMVRPKKKEKKKETERDFTYTEEKTT